LDVLDEDQLDGFAVQGVGALGFLEFQRDRCQVLHTFTALGDGPAAPSIPGGVALNDGLELRHQAVQGVNTHLIARRKPVHGHGWRSWDWQTVSWSAHALLPHVHQAKQCVLVVNSQGWTSFEYAAAVPPGLKGNPVACRG
jgi:hypothetical protein